MKPTVTFVTSNDVKFQHAAEMAAELGFEILREYMDLQEIQAEDGAEIARYKVAQAYNKLQRPVVVSDDTWVIPGLKGFPGPYMKSINTWFTPQDWLRLTRELTDRRIILRQQVVYQDANVQKHFVEDIEGILLSEIRGEHYHSHLNLTSFDGGKHSGAELLATGKPAIATNTNTVWHHLGAWLTTK